MARRQFVVKVRVFLAVILTLAQVLSGIFWDQSYYIGSMILSTAIPIHFWKLDISCSAKFEG